MELVKVAALMSQLLQYTGHSVHVSKLAQPSAPTTSSVVPEGTPRLLFFLAPEPFCRSRAYSDV